MRLKVIAAAAAVGLGLLAFNPARVSAHEAITAGEYTIEYGWQNEPPVANQPNALFLHITKASAGGSETPTPEAGQGMVMDGGGDPASGEEAAGLTVTVVYGDQSKTLTLQPLGEDTPGEFIAPLTPTIPGIYTVRLGGSLGSTAVNAEVQPEEVLTPDAVQFPRVEAGAETAANTFGLAGWLGLAGTVLGLAGIILALAALRRR